MQYDQYTADAITHAMGIGPFAGGNIMHYPFWFRLLLKPSFHPELCITFSDNGQTCNATATCLYTMLWHEDRPHQLPTFYESQTVTVFKLKTIQSAISRMRILEADGICIDGIGLNAAWKDGNKIKQFASHITSDTLTDTVADILKASWHIFETDGIRNGIAESGKYVGLNFRVKPKPPKPRELLILGQAQKVTDYFARLKDDRIVE